MNYPKINNLEKENLIIIQNKLKELLTDKSLKNLDDQCKFVKQEMINSFGFNRYTEIKYLLKTKSFEDNIIKNNGTDFKSDKMILKTPNNINGHGVFHKCNVKTELNTNNSSESYNLLISIIGKPEYFKNGLDLSKLKNEDNNSNIKDFKNWYIISFISLKLKKTDSLIITQKQVDNTWIEARIQVEFILFSYGYK